MSHSVFSRTAFLFLLTTFLACSNDEQEVAPSPSKVLLRSYEVTTTNSTLRGEFFYNADSTLARLDWKRETPNVTQGSDVYSYDSEGNVTEMIRTITGLHDERITYRFENQKPFLTEHYINGDRLYHIFYDYDDKGRLIHSEQNDKVVEAGGHLRGREYEYVYNAEGNLSQIREYSFIEATAQLVLQSVHTFSNFTNGLNPLQPIDPLPNITFQKNLPGSLTVESDGLSRTYTYQYTFRSDGLPATRTATLNNAIVETLTYEY